MPLNNRSMRFSVASSMIMVCHVFVHRISAHRIESVLKSNSNVSFTSSHSNSNACYRARSRSASPSRSHEILVHIMATQHNTKHNTLFNDFRNGLLFESMSWEQQIKFCTLNVRWIKTLGVALVKAFNEQKFFNMLFCFYSNLHWNWVP